MSGNASLDRLSPSASPRAPVRHAYHLPVTQVVAALVGLQLADVTPGNGWRFVGPAAGAPFGVEALNPAVSLPSGSVALDARREHPHE